jgi:hypothetical protein
MHYHRPISTRYENKLEAYTRTVQHKQLFGCIVTVQCENKLEAYT